MPRLIRSHQIMLQVLLLQGLVKEPDEAQKNENLQ